MLKAIDIQEQTMKQNGLHPFKLGQRLFQRGHQVPKNHPQFYEILNGWIHEYGYKHGLEGKAPRLIDPAYSTGYTAGKKSRYSKPIHHRSA